MRGLIELEDNPTRFVCQSHLNRRPRVNVIVYNAVVPGRFRQNHQDAMFYVIEPTHLFCEQAERDEVKINK